MSPPKDPAKYAEWVRKQHDSQIGRSLSNDTKQKITNGLITKWQDPIYRDKTCKSRIGRQSPMKGKKASKETRERQSKARLGHIGYTKGKHHTQETKDKIGKASTGRTHTVSEEARQKLRETNTGKYPSEETRKKMSSAGKLRPPISEETRRKMSKSNSGKSHPPVSEETCRKISNALSGSNCYWFGKHLSDNHKIKLVENRVGGFWYGNILYYEPLYCEKFTQEFKERVRAFWDYQCFECGSPQNGEKLHVHHIHYNKKTCCDGSPQDMIPLCRSCHTATNSNRDYWEQYFTTLLYLWSPAGKCFFTEEEMQRVKSEYKIFSHPNHINIPSVYSNIEVLT